MASIIERIDLGCASNLMRVLISLTAASFIFQIDMDSNQRDMLETILMMAKRLNLNTLAEGVETDAE